MCKFALYCTVNIQTRSHSPVYINYTADSDQVPLPVSITPQIQTRSHSPKSITLQIQTRSHSPISITLQFRIGPALQYHLYHTFRPGPVHSVSITQQIYTLQVPLPSVDYTADALVSKENGL